MSKEHREEHLNIIETRPCKYCGERFPIAVSSNNLIAFLTGGAAAETYIKLHERSCPLRPNFPTNKQ
jgi:hypothetical protein